jgi:hypothetical protein
VIEGEAASLAAEVRATAMAAFRVAGKGKGRVRRESDVSMGGADGRVPESPGRGESDAALIGLESESEGEMEGDEAEVGADEDD